MQKWLFKVLKGEKPTIFLLQKIRKSFNDLSTKNLAVWFFSDNFSSAGVRRNLSSPGPLIRLRGIIMYGMPIWPLINRKGLQPELPGSIAKTNAVNCRLAAGGHWPASAQFRYLQ